MASTYIELNNVNAGGGGGATDFTDLNDVPSSYAGNALQVVRVNAGETGLEFSAGATGDVTGPGSSTDNAVTRFDGTTGKILQNSAVTIDDSGNIATAGTIDGRDVSADGTKLDTIETSADVTDTANVTAAGALMDSELTNEAAVKALDQGLATTDSPTFVGVTGTLQTASQPNVDHDSLTNFVANEHIDHSGVNITAGDGLSGGGDLTATRTLSVDINSATGATVASGDEVLISDVDNANAIRKTTAGDIAALAPQGDVAGPASATDNAIARYDLTTGKLLQNSAVTIDDSGNIVTAGTVDGRDISVDGTKLDTVETNADITDTANVTAAGALMDSELTNEAAVKAIDQGLATTDSPTFAATTINGNITVTGTIDGRDVAADGTKLDGIEAGADVTDTTNVTAAGALMDSELTNEAAVKAINQGLATTDSPTFADITGTLQTAAQPNITSVGTLTSATVSGDLTVDTDVLKVDAATDRVGIGTASPTVKLAVNGNTEISASTFIPVSNTDAALKLKGSFGGGLVFDDINFGAIWASDAGNKLSFAIGGTNSGFGDNTQLILDGANNRVGIMTETPTATLDVKGVIHTTSAGINDGYHINGNTAMSTNDNTLRFNNAGEFTLGSRFVGNVEVASGSLTATIATAAQPNITSVGTLTSATVSGDLTVDTDVLKVDATTNRVGIGTSSPNTSSILDLSSTTGALLLPRMTTVQRNALTATNGMLIYNTTDNKFQGYENGAWANLI